MKKYYRYGLFHPFLFRRAGFSIIEITLVIFIGAMFAGLLFTGLWGYKNRNDFDTTTQEIVAVLREAQSLSAARASSTTWGIHFENSTTTAPFFAIFSATYGTSTRTGYYRLPPSVVYVSSSIAQGDSKEIIFSQITGFLSAADSVVLQNISGSTSSTISITTNGVVTY
ncbi:MAG: hypothetical protein NUV53_01330 [Patescibacteria group bacterium]|nr:hypothetical protein [Patescibacteria group bacterium]